MSVVTTIGGLPIDVVKRLTPKFSSTTTDHPVSGEADVTDNIRTNPDELAMDCVISNNPIGAIATDESRAGSKPAKDCYDKLYAMHIARLPILVVCTLGKFESMAVVGLSPAVTSDSGDSLVFTINLKRIVIVKNNRVTVRVAVPNAAGQTNLGDKANKLWSARTGNTFGDVIYVVSYLSSLRATVTKSFGAPIFLRTGTTEYDCYQIVGDTVPDGYLNKEKTRYTAISVGRPAGPDVANPEVIPPQPLGAPDSHYNYGRKRWEDKNGEPVTKTPPPPGPLWKRAQKGGK